MILPANDNPHRDRRTTKMAAGLLVGLDYEILNPINYRVEPLYSAQVDGDWFEQVQVRVVTADVIVPGTPAYWHSFDALSRTFFERMCGAPPAGLTGRKLAFFIRGDQSYIEPGTGVTTYAVTRSAVLYDLELIGTALDTGDLPALHKVTGATV